MAEQSQLGTTNWDQWTLSMAVEALTGDTGLNLSWNVAEKPFLEWDPKAGEITEKDKVPGSYFSYFAFKQLRFRVTFNTENYRTWADQVVKVSDVLAELTTSGRRGVFDLSSIAYLSTELTKLHRLLVYRAESIQGWAKWATGEDGPLDGKAIDVIRARLDQYSRTLQKWSDQLVNDRGAEIMEAVNLAHEVGKAVLTGLRNVAFTPAEGYDYYMSYLASLPSIKAVDIRTQIRNYLRTAGMVAGTPGYVLDKIRASHLGLYDDMPPSGDAKGDAKGAVERYINRVLTAVPVDGKAYNLLSEAGWKGLDKTIEDAMMKEVEKLGNIAAKLMMSLHGTYTLLSRSFPTLDEPARLNANTAEWTNLNTNLDMNFSMPDLNMSGFDFNLDFNSSGLDFNMSGFDFKFDPSGFDGGNFDLNGYNPNLYGGGPNFDFSGGGPNLDFLGGGPNGYLNPNGFGEDFFGSIGGSGGGSGGLPDFSGGDGFGGSGPGLGGLDGLPGGIPGLGPIGGLGPNGEILNPNGRPILGPNGEILGPDGRPILGPNGEILGPDGEPILGPNGEILGPNGRPILGSNGEILGPDGQPILGPNGQPILGGPITVPGLGPITDPITVPGLGPITVPDIDPITVPDLGGGGAGGVGGLPGLSGAGGDGLSPIQVLSDGTMLGGEKLAAAPANEVAYGSMPGMPFYPPMGGMGGMGAGNRDRDERERQTWLTEDEAVWGTKAKAVGAVIGRPEDAEEADEELVILGPVRGARPTPQSGAKSKKPQDQATKKSQDQGAQASSQGAQVSGQGMHASSQGTQVSGQEAQASRQGTEASRPMRGIDSNN